MRCDIRQKGNHELLMKMTNLGIRVLQMIFAATVIGIYSVRIGDEDWWPLRGKLVLAETAGAMSLVTAVVFAALPFLISYYCVAIAFIWDWIIFFIWCAVFAFQHKWFGDKYVTDALKDQRDPRLHGVDTMIAAQWIDLAAMLLFLVSALMGPICLWWDHMCPRGSRSKAIA